MDSTIKLSKNKHIEGELNDEATMLLELIKEYYLNYPLKAQNTSVTNSLLDELEFFSLNENNIKTLHRGGILHIKKKKSASDILEDYKPIIKARSLTNQPRSPEQKGSSQSISPQNLKFSRQSSPTTKDINDFDKQSLGISFKDPDYIALWKIKTCHLAIGTECILSIIHSPYLTSKIIVRDLTGNHSWMITEHRALKYNFLEKLDYNDKSAILKNIFNLKGEDNSQKKASIVECKKEALVEISISNNNEKEKDRKENKEVDTLDQVFSLFCKSFVDSQIVKSFLLIFSLPIW